MSLDDFLESFSSAIVTLTRHHISKKQSASYKLAKESLKEDEVLIVGDFAENYLFVVQNAAIRKRVAFFHSRWVKKLNVVIPKFFISMINIPYPHF